jgi:pyruvate formate lyase activating enzyme
VSDLTARILHLQRLSTEDGPGIRTTVFFKGCPLRCAWCHNPESLLSNPQIQWVEGHCIACNTCLESCPQGSLSRAAGGALVIDRQQCDGCGECAEACPANAIELLGRTVTVEELVAEVVKDRSYYDASGGGVTVSGGEPGLQPEFVAEFLRQVKAAGISTALDTCGLVSRPGLEKILPYVDLVLYDLKEIDPQKHRDFTAQGNERILETLLYLVELKRTRPTLCLWVRTPLIPGATATPKNLMGIGTFLTNNVDSQIERWELCAFNNLCRDKYRRLGMSWYYQDTPLLTRVELDELTDCARHSGIRPELVFATGATRALSQTGDTR